MKGAEYRFKGNEQRIAFEDHGKKISTAMDSPSVIRSLVDLAEAKGWTSLRIGHESTAEFRKAVWIEASARGIKAIGHEPTRDDQERMERERSARAGNSIQVVEGRMPSRLQGSAPRPFVAPAAVELATREASSRGVSDPAVLAKVMSVATEQHEALARQGRTVVARIVDPEAPKVVPQVQPAQPEHARSARSR